jgi:hypothetical protein
VRTVEARGHVEYDLVNTQPFRVGAAARVVRLGREIQPGASVRPGQLIMELDCDDARYFQNLHLWQLERKLREAPTESLLNEVISSAQHLRKLGFTDKLMVQLCETRQIWDPWPLRTPRAGIVVAVAASGDHLAAGDALYTIAWRQVVHLRVCQGDKPSWGTQAVVRIGERAIAARVGQISPLGPDFLARIDLLEHRCPAPLGAQAVVSFEIAAPPERYLTAGDAAPFNLATWPHASFPRGTELRKLIDQHELKDLAAQLPPRPIRSAAPPAPTPRPHCIAPPPDLPPAERTRPGLIMDRSRAQSAGLEFAVAALRDIMTSVQTSGIVCSFPPPRRKLRVKAPIAGEALVAPGMLGRPLLSGDPIGTIASDALLHAQQAHLAALRDDVKTVARSALQLGRMGMSTHDIAELEATGVALGCAVVRAPFPCIVSAWQPAAGARVAPGTCLATGVGVEGTSVTFDIAASVLTGLGSRIAIEISRYEAACGDVALSRRGEVIVTSRQAGSCTARIELPHLPDDMAIGTPVRVILSDMRSRRQAVMIPADTVILIAASRQAMVDEGVVIRPRTLAIGSEHGDCVEVIAGLAEGERVVRRLPDRAGKSRRLTSLLMGLSSKTYSWEHGLDC